MRLRPPPILGEPMTWRDYVRLLLEAGIAVVAVLAFLAWMFLAAPAPR